MVCAVSVAMVSGTGPPMKRPASMETDVDPASDAGMLIPYVIKEAIHTLVAAIRYLEKRGRCDMLVATTHRKIRVLLPLGSHAPRRGLSCLARRLRTTDRQETFFLSSWTRKRQANHSGSTADPQQWTWTQAPRRRPIKDGHSFHSIRGPSGGRPAAGEADHRTGCLSAASAALGHLSKA